MQVSITLASTTADCTLNPKIFGMSTENFRKSPPTSRLLLVLETSMASINLVTSNFNLFSSGSIKNTRKLRSMPRKTSLCIPLLKTHANLASSFSTAAAEVPRKNTRRLSPTASSKSISTLICSMPTAPVSEITCSARRTTSPLKSVTQTVQISQTRNTLILECGSAKVRRPCANVSKKLWMTLLQLAKLRLLLLYADSNLSFI